MRSLDDGFDRRLPLTHGLARGLRVLGEYRGKEELHRAQMPQVLETLRKVAVIQSAESSSRIEGVTAAPRRFRELMAAKTRPRDRSEQEIAGYRDALNTIHANYGDMRLTSDLVRQLHRDLFKYTDQPGGEWKNSPNRITERHPNGSLVVRFEPVAPHLVPSAMDELHVQWRERVEEREVDSLLLIPAYILDFLCIHPFLDGNGRLARLLTLLVLYQAGYQVGRFISLERLVEASKESYYDALQASSRGWHKGEHSLRPWTEYLLGVLMAAYRELEHRIGLMTAARGAKTAAVLQTIQHFHGDFSTAELQAQCPHVGIDLIRRILRRERMAGRLECLGRGRGARWQRI